MRTHFACFTPELGENTLATSIGKNPSSLSLFSPGCRECICAKLRGETGEMCPQTQPIFDGVIKSVVFQKLGAEILEKGKVFPNLLVTDLLTMKMPKDFAFSNNIPSFLLHMNLL